MAEVLRHILSKSTFMYGCQCPKRLWLHKFMPELRDEADENQQAIFQAGTDVGMLARDLFPGGVDASPVDTFHYQQSVADTARYIAEGKTVIDEAAFQFDGLLCAVDMLVKKKGGWYAYEVKSTTKVKPPFLQDASFQYYIISNAGIPLKDFFLTYLNNKYIRRGALNPQKLFTHESILQQALDLQPMIKEKARELKSVLKNKTMPVVEIGRQCEDPYPCYFYGFCSKGMEMELPVYGEAFIDRAAINKFLQQLQYPIYHIDFETWMTAVPMYDGHWPLPAGMFSVFCSHTKNCHVQIRAPSLPGRWYS